MNRFELPESMSATAANAILEFRGVHDIDEDLVVAQRVASGLVNEQVFNELHMSLVENLDKLVGSGNDSFDVSLQMRGLSKDSFDDACKFFERTIMDTAVLRDTDNLVRKVDFRAASVSDGLTLDGYGAVFNEWTEINDHLGSYRERILPGAFKRTIGQRTPVLQFDHGAHPLIGSIPLGRITSISEDAHGLRVKAKLSDNWLVEPVRDAIRDGGVSGMSFRFRVIDESWARASDGIEERSIKEIELYEVGPVVFPAYEQTTVGVRSRDTLAALADPDVRSEIARLLTNGTDVESLAESDTSDDIHVSESDAPASSHARTRTITQRKAVALLRSRK